jgi:hypothetical protein
MFWGIFYISRLFCFVRSFVLLSPPFNVLTYECIILRSGTLRARALRRRFTRASSAQRLMSPTKLRAQNVDVWVDTYRC